MADSLDELERITRFQSLGGRSGDVVLSAEAVLSAISLAREAEGLKRENSEWRKRWGAVVERAETAEAECARLRDLGTAYLNLLSVIEGAERVGRDPGQAVYDELTRVSLEFRSALNGGSANG